MFSIQQSQWDGLNGFRELVKQANYELADSFETGRMSDSKTAVFNVMNASETLNLPEELLSQFQDLGRAAWHGAVSGNGESSDVYARAGAAIAVIGQIEKLIDSINVGTP
jgi:hypothetical protein